MTIKLGDALPDLTLNASGGQQIALRSLVGRKLVLYFYPKDDTSGCTLEGQNFRDAKADFDAADCRILGVSRDSVRKHDNFIAKYEFNFDLLSDPDEALCQAFDVMREKSMYGRKYMGVDRSTFIFDAQGRLAREWRGVKVPGHVDEVLAAVRELA